MEAATRKRLWQKAKNIYYSIRNLLCFFVSVEAEDVIPGPSTSGISNDKTGSELSAVKSNDSTSEECFFPFEALPEDCQLHVFSHLSVLERGETCLYLMMTARRVAELTILEIWGRAQCEAARGPAM